MVDYKFLEWKRTSENSFDVFYEENRRKIEAEEIYGIHKVGSRYYGFMSKNGGKFTLYLKSFVIEYWCGCYKFEKDILEYRECGDMLLYRKEDGWYVVNFSSSCRCIHFQDVKYKRHKDVAKICGPEVEIIECQVISFIYGCKAHIVKTTDGVFFLYGKDGSAYEDLSVAFLHGYKYFPIKGYPGWVRIYPRKNSKYFFIARIYAAYLDSVTPFRGIMTDECLGLEDLGGGNLIMKKGKQRKLIDIYTTPSRNINPEIEYTGDSNFLGHVSTCIDWGAYDENGMLTQGRYHLVKEDGREYMFREPTLDF